MPKDAKGAVARALDILKATPYSTVVNGYVLTSDQHAELLEILETGGESSAEPQAESKRTTGSTSGKKASKKGR